MDINIAAIPKPHILSVKLQARLRKERFISFKVCVSLMMRYTLLREGYMTESGGYAPPQQANGYTPAATYGASACDLITAYEQDIRASLLKYQK